MVSNPGDWVGRGNKMKMERCGGDIQLRTEEERKEIKEGQPESKPSDDLDYQF